MIVKVTMGVDMAIVVAIVVAIVYFLILLFVFCVAVAALIGPSIIAVKLSDNLTVKCAIWISNLGGLALFFGGGFFFPLPWLGLLGLGLWIVAWVLVYRTKVAVRRPVRVVLYLMIILLIARTFLFQPFNIVGGGEKATILDGDYLFVSKYSYGYSQYSLPLSPPLFSGRILASPPERGDYVDFRLPKDTSTDYIKRVIGLPGDKIQVIDGIVNINGVPVKRVKAPDFIETEEGTREVPVKRWKETLPNGVSFYTLDLVDNGFADNTQVYTVPPDHYFVMGDNRDKSTDSRFSQVGMVPFENIVGRAQIIFFSVYEGERAWQFWRWPISVRWNRLFTIVR